MIGAVGSVPPWIGLISAGFSIWLIISAFQKAPPEDPTFFNFLRPKRLIWGIFLLAMSADIIFFPYSS